MIEKLWAIEKTKLCCIRMTGNCGTCLLLLRLLFTHSAAPVNVSVCCVLQPAQEVPVNDQELPGSARVHVKFRH